MGKRARRRLGADYVRPKVRAAITSGLDGLAEIGAIEYTADRGVSIELLDHELLELARTGGPGELRAELERRQDMARSDG